VKKRLAIILGIRPDVIRASLILDQIRALDEFDVKFIWSGQHYSDNLKDIFFRELGVAPPDVELGARGSTDAEVVASVIASLYPVLEELRPEAAVFLGDTNTVMGCLAAAQLNIPIVHIEGCMRSYDWRMPEEKYRSTIDHLSDVIYTYFDEYKAQGVAEGLNPRRILVVQNLIVDVLHKYFFERKNYYDGLATDQFFHERNIERGQYYLMTCHRRENVERRETLAAVLELLRHTDRTIYFCASYRTQGNLKRFQLQLPPNVRMVDPVGYTEMLLLAANARGVVTDSGTVVEETAVLQVPSVQMRKATERPQVYDCGSSVKFDPDNPARYPAERVWHKLEQLHGRGWSHNLGDGQASSRVVADLTHRLRSDGFRMHKPEHYHLNIARSYRDDGLCAISRSMNVRSDRPLPGGSQAASLAVVIPMFNEQAGAARCVAGVTAALPPLGRRCRLIVVEDGSGDRTADVLDEVHRRGSDFTFIRHEQNRGYGAALRTGATEAKRQGYDYVLFMDSDLTNPPEHIVNFLPAMDGGADVIKGCRYCSGGRVQGVPFWRYIISRLGNLIVTPLFAVGVRDATNGFRCIRTEVFLSLPYSERGFASIMEEMYWAKRRGCTFANVPTTLHNRAEDLRGTSFSYKPATFYRYFRYALKAALVSRSTGQRPGAAETALKKAS
jgi:UDP-N-acetylglucosamine 2-epimerase